MLHFEMLLTNQELCASIQTGLIRQGLLEPPVDGIAGKFTRAAFKIWSNGSLEFTPALLEKLELPLPPVKGNDLPAKIVRKMQELNYFVSRGDARFNIVYLEGMNLDGTLNQDKFNNWNDLRLVLEWRLGEVPKIVGKWLATSEPGGAETPNAKGMAMIPLPSQFKAWRVGIHKAGTRTAHEALVQVLPITVLRSKKKPPSRVGATLDTGLFGINQHHGWNSKVVANNSVGCMVGVYMSEHIEFMSLMKSDSRYLLDKSYTFYTTALDGAKV